jgi:hypothetical protein
MMPFEWPHYCKLMLEKEYVEINPNIFLILIIC